MTLFKIWITLFFALCAIGLTMDFGPWKFKMRGYTLGYLALVPIPLFILYFVWSM